MRKKVIIGGSEKIDLPEMNLYNIDAKVDTGADSSAIHCHHIEIVRREGKKVLHFILLDPSHPDYNNKSFYFDQFKQKTIKNSFGDSEKRYVIRTPVAIFKRRYKTELSLTYRGNLRYPILLGKKFLMRRFLVDVTQSDLSSMGNKLTQ
ncbi:MAG: ATP-dependent zinc protease family protein [Cyclobacteriaceae bacterium]